MASTKSIPGTGGGLKDSPANRKAIAKANKKLGLKGKAASAGRSSTTGKKLAGNTAKQRATRKAATGAAKARVAKSAPKAAAARAGGSASARRSTAKATARDARVAGKSGSGKGGAG